MMSPHRCATCMHVQDFLVNDELLLPILKAFVQCTETPCVVFRMLDVFQSGVLAEESVFLPIAIF